MLGVAEIWTLSVHLSITALETGWLVRIPEGLWTRNDAVAGDIWAQASATVGVAVVELVTCGAGTAMTSGMRNPVIPMTARVCSIAALGERMDAMLTGDYDLQAGGNRANCDEQHSPRTIEAVKDMMSYTLYGSSTCRLSFISNLMLVPPRLLLVLIHIVKRMKNAVL